LLLPLLKDLTTCNSLAIKHYKELSDIMSTGILAELLYDLRQRVANMTLAENLEISDEPNIVTFRKELKV
jgi:hypothetical protein